MVGVYILLQSPSSVISDSFDDERTARKWSVQGQAEAQFMPDGLLLKPRGTALLISPRLQKPRGSTLNWHSFPYVKLRVTPEKNERRMALVWIFGSDINANYPLPFTIPAMASEILLDVRQDVPWEQRFGWDQDALSRLPIKHIGVLLQNTVKVEQIEWISGLGPLELLPLLWAQYWAVEPVKVSSVNVHYGNEVLGKPLVMICGIIFAFLLALMLFTRQKKFRLPLLWAILACFAIPNTPFIGTLWNQAKASSKVSAWHANRYDEYRSRFNQEFADLDKEFLKHVPTGSQVAFPASKQRLVQGESNWLWFLYYGLYENYKDRLGDSTHLDKKTEYVFYYYPAGLTHDEENNLLRRNKGDTTYATQTIARISGQAKILKLIHG